MNTETNTEFDMFMKSKALVKASKPTNHGVIIISSLFRERLDIEDIADRMNTTTDVIKETVDKLHAVVNKVGWETF